MIENQYHNLAKFGFFYDNGYYIVRDSLPFGYDWTLYEIVNHKIIDNEDSETNRFYKKELVVIIEEKNIFPEELGDQKDWYAHGFGTPIQHDDFPTKDSKTSGGPYS